jgi:hypothetical protein
MNQNELEKEHDSYIKGLGIRVLASSVDSNDDENIELVPVKAKAGYALGYNYP